MPVNLKPYYDAALAADAEVQSIMSQMDAAFNEGTEEGKSKALELRPKLEEAQNAAKEANQLYSSMRDASNTTDNSAARNFVPDPAAPSAETGKVKTLAEYNALHPRERLAFAQAGGRIEN